MFTSLPLGIWIIIRDAQSVPLAADMLSKALTDAGLQFQGAVDPKMQPGKVEGALAQNPDFLINALLGHHRLPDSFRRCLINGCWPATRRSENPLDRREVNRRILSQFVWSIPLVLRFGTNPTGILATTFMVLVSTTTVASSPAAAT